jgi:ATP-dependent RNA helicase DBP3
MQKSEICPPKLPSGTPQLTMGKRAISEVIAEDRATTKSETLSRKKSRKDKSEKPRKPATRDDSDSPSDGKAPEEIENGSNILNTAEKVLENGTDEEKLSKAERKALKKAKKEAKEAKKSKKLQSEEGSASQSLTNGVEQDEDAAKAARKAARKAEKKRLKALAKEAGADSSATPSTLPSASTSALPSRAESSATSPEPAEESGAAYTQHPDLTALPQSEIDSFLTAKQILINDPSPSTRNLRPITKFSYLPITNKTLLAPFATFTEPTPIQAATWPALFSGRDMIGVAETGSGKTLAFGVPCARHISSLPRNEQRGVKAVIVSPTRELASQIHDQLVKLATPLGLSVVCVYGGVPKEPQAQAIRRAHIVVATPGRLQDLIGDGSADLSGVQFMVLDEADRMLDKGFEEPIRQIIQCTPKQRQTLMFTATWPDSVRDLANTFMQSPVKIIVGDNPTGELRANTRIKQVVEVVDPRDKNFRLLQLLKQYQSGANKNDKILVFCLYKKEATRVEDFLRQKGFRVGGIHGDLSQEKRTASLAAFKEGKVPLLVATDVAARGLDIPAVKVVINVTFPLTAEDYVHRIGRTGRAGKEGLAVTLFTELDKHLSGA